MKKIAIIGRPNVGKSSFFNRVIKERDAITSDFAGTTRDVKRRIVTILEKEALLLDTGGLDEGNELFDRIREKSIQAAKEADIIIYMVDGRTLPEEEDKKFFYELEQLGKDVALVVNKLDNDKLEENLYNYYEFGTEHIFPVSISHNRRVNALLEWLAVRLPKSQAANMVAQVDGIEDDFESFLDNYTDEGELNKGSDVDTSNINIAIIGRVNVGKSSLLNALIKEDRSVVSNVAGTTIDPINETIVYADKNITFVDTAGIRKRGKIVGIEKYALQRTETMLESADIALLVLDSSEPFKELDEKIAGLVDQNMLGCIIVLNKWDISDAEYHEIEQVVRDKFKFLSFAPIITISALTKQRVHKLFDMILRVFDNYTQRISTSKLNDTIKEAIIRHHLPSPSGKLLKIYYATQYEVKPPKIALIMNRPGDLHFSYRRYLTNKIREAFDFEGTPVLFKVTKRGNNEEES